MAEHALRWLLGVPGAAGFERAVALGALGLLVVLQGGCGRRSSPTWGDAALVDDTGRRITDTVWDSDVRTPSSDRSDTESTIDARLSPDADVFVSGDVPALRDDGASADAQTPRDTGNGDDVVEVVDGRLGDAGSDAADALQGCECTEGPCCDGCDLLPTGMVCAVEQELGCPWGSDCASAVGVRDVLRLCSGTAPTCSDGPTFRGEWRPSGVCDAGASCVEGRGDCVPSPACPCPAGMVHVPAGVFPMGASAASEHPGVSDEYPQHEVHVQPYCIDRYEVTAGAYVEFLNDAARDNDCRVDAGQEQPCGCLFWPFPLPWPDLSPSPPVDQGGTPSANWSVGSTCQPAPHTSPLSDCSSHPITFVTWRGARRYCDWAGKRLPSEAEWERAAKGTTDRQYVWGDDAVFEGRANCGENLCADGFDYYDEESRSAYEYPSPVGSFPLDRSPAGAYDMEGNVSEWVEDDWHHGYAGAPDDGSAWITAPEGSAYPGKVLRGGAFDTQAAWGLLTTERSGGGGLCAGGGDFGFRCAWSPAPPP